MKPKAKKFRIRRSSSYGTAARPERPPEAPEAEKPPIESVKPLVEPEQPPAIIEEPKDILSDDEQTTLSPREEIEQIKSENLTGRQLRIARREAQKHNLNPASDLDAVRLLRRAGHDPFKRNDLLELVVSRDTAGGPSNLPAAIRNAPVPSADVITPDVREFQIHQIQVDLAKRRRKRLVLVLVRLLFFVAFPTVLAGYYYNSIASNMYATKSEFLIQQADTAGSSAMGGLFSGTSIATSQDSITVQSYLNSKEAMLRLNRDHGFKLHFQNPAIDVIQRLEAGATNDAAYRIYQKRVRIGYDPTEGIIKMEVVASTPEASRIFSQALIAYAEEQVDQLTQRLRGDQMKGARESYQLSEDNVLAAQRRVLELQEKRGVLSADLEISSRMQQISTFEVELKNRKLELAGIMDNPQPNKTKVRLAERAIQRLANLIAEMRLELTEGTGNTESLAKTTGELVIAQADLQTRQLLLSTSLQQLETARVEANRQVRYLSLGVPPVAPDEASYPRAFENTLLAFLIFAGLYLMASLTSSILREQVNS